MGLPEPVSGSHVGAATVPGPVPSLIPPAQHCSLPSPNVSSSSPTIENPRSSNPPPPNPDLSSDPVPTTLPAPSSGVVRPPARFPRPDLAPDHCSAVDSQPFPPFKSSANPSSSRSAPLSPKSAGLHSRSSSSALPSHGPTVAPADHRYVPLNPILSNLPSSQIPSNPLSSTSISVPIIPDQSLPSPSQPVLAHPPPSGLQSGVAPPLSYAQATRGPRGPGFVRSHAADVESFARLPRTGVNIICGSRDGAPAFSFPSSDLPKVEELYSNALVMKFLGGRPSLETSHREILSWGIEKPFSIGPMSSKAFLLRFQDSKDLVRVLSRPSSILITFPYRVFRWHNLYHIKEDSCFAPVWISLPKLPLQCFIPEFLEAVANKIGRFLCFDKATATLARPSVARMCVELDLRKNQPPSIWVGLFEGFKQPVIYERLPKFCSNCLSQGHIDSACPWGHRETIPNQTQPRSDVRPHRPPDARRNASKGKTAYSQTHSYSGAFIPTPTSIHHSSTIPSSTSVPSPVHLHVEPLVEHTIQAADPLPEKLDQVVPPPTPHPINLDNSQPPSSHIQIPTLSISAYPNVSKAKGSPALRGPIHFDSSSGHSKKSILRKGKKKKKSVSFALPAQSNLSANNEFWNAVSSHIAMLGQGPASKADVPISVPQVVEEVQPSTYSSTQSQSDQGGDESSASSIAADSPPPSPTASSRPRSYASEGEDTITERSPMLGHNTDDLLKRRSHHSKKNKRHPDQPLNIQLRVRKDPSSTTQ